MIDEKIEDCIADYCARRISHDDFACLREWLAADEGNREVLARHLKMYKRGRAIALAGNINHGGAWRDILVRLRRRRRSRVLVAASAAAVIALAIVFVSVQARRDGHVGEPGRSVAVLDLGDGREINLSGERLVSAADGTFASSAGQGAIVYEDGDAQPAIHSVRVPSGGEYAVVLSDGTHILLNSCTRLRYPTRFTGDKREVWVEGEIYLEVTPDSLRKFIVHTADADIEVLGTSFNVSAYPSDAATVTTLVSGIVSVAAAGELVKLRPGMQATVDRGGANVSVREVDTGPYVSWTTGAFEFENMPLGQICERLSRWYGVEFDFVDAELAERRFTGGTWKYVPLDDFLQTIEKSTDISLRTRGARVVVAGKKR